MPVLEKPYAIGTDVLIDALERDIVVSDNNLVMVNINLLIRNQLSGDGGLIYRPNPDEPPSHVDVVKLYAKLRVEMEAIITDVAHAFSKTSIPNPTLLFYIFNYGNVIPADQARPLIPSRKMAIQARAHILKQRDLFVEPITVDGLTVESKAIVGKLSPTYVLGNIIRHYSPNGLVTMLSNCPLDFHAGRSRKGFKIIESHTGNIKRYSDLSKKVLKTELLPFGPIIHELLGDKEYLVSILSSKEKRELIKQAEREQWTMQSYDYVRKKLSQLGLIGKIRINLE